MNVIIKQTDKLPNLLWPERALTVLGISKYPVFAILFLGLSFLSLVKGSWCQLPSALAGVKWQDLVQRLFVPSLLTGREKALSPSLPFR